MFQVVKTFLVLLIELSIFYVMGTVFNQYIMKAEKQAIPQKVIYGFLVIQIFFQIYVFPFIILDGSLKLLARIWSFAIVVLAILCVIKIKDTVIEDYNKIKSYIKQNKGIVALVIIVIFAICYYVSINGEQNDDAVYYIGLISTTLDTDRMYRFNVYTGEGMDSLYLRRALVTFEIHSAALCSIFNIHPLVLARIGRASLNVVLTSMAIYLIGMKLFAKDEKRENKSCMLIVLTLAMNFLFIGNYYTGARFLLTRAYEGKAFGANVLVLFTTYICMKIISENQQRDFKILILVIWGSTAISTSAVMVNSVVIILLLTSYYMIRLARKVWVRKNDKC